MGSSLDTSAWAKTVPLKEGGVATYPLLCHLIDTAAAAMTLWDAYLTASQRRVISSGLGAEEPTAKALVGFWAGMHDLGKLTPGFQRCHDGAWAGVSGTLRSSVGGFAMEAHDRAGLRTAVDVLAGLGYDLDDGNENSAGWRVAQMIGGHHGRFKTANFDVECVGPFALDDLGGLEWRRQRETHVKLVHALLGAPAAPDAVPDTVAVLVTGLIILADWLVSQESYLVERIRDGVVGPEEHMAAAGRAVSALVGEAGLDASTLGWNPFDFQELFGIAEPNPLQRSMVEELPTAVNGPGILVVTTSMGDGKTEIALCAQRIMATATGTEGFYFGLPTMATSDQIYQRVRAYAGKATTGPAAVTLAHSMAWLNHAYAGDAHLARTGRVVSGDGSARGRTAAPAWLHAGKRPLLARIGTGTIDQALAAMLPVRHNALRLLALSGRTLIIDEAHAYDPYMQVLLERLLTWLAHYKCPVILLSATLPASTADRLVRAYLRGAGWTLTSGKKRLPTGPYRCPYPGWVYVDAATATATYASDAVIDEHTELRSTQLQIEMCQVRHEQWEIGGQPAPGSRLHTIATKLAPVVEHGGTAAIVCTTVADAQATYEFLRTIVFKDLPDDELCLLHARLPADVREQRTNQIVGRLGRSGPRPDRMVLVATQVIEQSLDLDVDLMISDLAPVSLLLQRAGRCWRHEKFWSAQAERPRKRPEWSNGPRLLTLVPVDAGGEVCVPRHWGSVYHPYLLVETASVLSSHAGTCVNLPEQVQELVEKVYGRASAFTRQAEEIDAARPASASRTAWDGEDLAQRQVADCLVIPRPGFFSDLSALHPVDLPEMEIGTRLGIDSIRVVCCFEQPGGRFTLDPEGALALPTLEPGRDRFTAAQIRQVMLKTVPVSATKLKGRGSETNPPSEWADNAWLSELVLLPHRRAGQSWMGTQIGSRTITLDRALGLVIDE